MLLMNSKKLNKTFEQIYNKDIFAAYKDNKVVI